MSSSGASRNPHPAKARPPLGPVRKAAKTGRPKTRARQLLAVTQRGIYRICRRIQQPYRMATDYSFAEKAARIPTLSAKARRAQDAQLVRCLNSRSTHEQCLGPFARWKLGAVDGIVGPHYAPGVQIAGNVAIAPAANMANIIIKERVNNRLRPYIALAYSRFYPDVRFEEAPLSGMFGASLCLAYQESGTIVV
jgi:hypothetical protein